MGLTIVIVSWNVKDALRKCLQAIFQHGGDVAYEVMVIDNASSDGTAEEFNSWRFNLDSRLNLITLISNSTNRGFATACNQGVRESLQKFFLFLNPDTQIQPGALEGLGDFFEKHPKAGVVGGKILNSDGTVQPSVRRFPGFWDQILILIGMHKLFSPVAATLRLRSEGTRAKARGYHGRYWLSVLNHYFASDFDYSREQEVDQVMGAFFAVRSEAWEQLGGFDEKFFLWFEEVDFCQRAKQAGWEVWYTPSCAVAHQGGASFRQRNRLGLRLIWLKSLWYYFSKHGWL